MVKILKEFPEFSVGGGRTGASHNLNPRSLEASCGPAISRQFGIRQFHRLPNSKNVKFNMRTQRQI